MGLRPAGSSGPAALRPPRAFGPPGIPRGCAPRATRSPAELGPRKRGQGRNPPDSSTVAVALGLSGPGRPSVTPTWPASRPPLRGAKTRTNHARPASRPAAQPGACARRGGIHRGMPRPKKQPARKGEGSQKGRSTSRRHQEPRERPPRPDRGLAEGLAPATRKKRLKTPALRASPAASPRRQRDAGRRGQLDRLGAQRWPAAPGAGPRAAGASMSREIA